jgi:hypothetical protein
MADDGSLFHCILFPSPVPSYAPPNHGICASNVAYLKVLFSARALRRHPP